MDKSEYVEKWVKREVTIMDWEKNKTIDHWLLLDQLDLNKYILREILNHQYQLFWKDITQKVNNLIGRIKASPGESGEVIIKEHFRLINLLFNSVELNPILLNLVGTITKIREEDYLAFMFEYQNIINGVSRDIRKDYCINQRGTNLRGIYYNARLLYEYRRGLLILLDETQQQQAIKMERVESATQTLLPTVAPIDINSAVLKFLDTVNGTNFKLKTGNTKVEFDLDGLHISLFSQIISLESEILSLYLKGKQGQVQRIYSLFTRILEGRTKRTKISLPDSQTAAFFTDREGRERQTDNITEARYSAIQEGYMSQLLSYIEYLYPELKTEKPTITATDKPQPPTKALIFSSQDKLESLNEVLKEFFPDREAELLRALQGERLREPLHFPHNQNKFVELFKRVKYNGYLVSTSTEIKEWICSNFTFQYKKGTVQEVRSFNDSTVWDLLTKDVPVRKAARIGMVEWLPYKSRSERDSEALKEKL
jgi:hypothetical protein